ncbi:hypothetical protein ALTERO38_52095 [Alteromonas sp. 38]|nr:hypothetical protein ALTER154_50131 [Alteromonas sp. 154]VXB98803.1 hypothetical protein ALTERO38_52095 [Alteromonas sp. 38]
MEFEVGGINSLQYYQEIMNENYTFNPYVNWRLYKPTSQRSP